MLADKRKPREIALELLNKVSIKTKTGTILFLFILSLLKKVGIVYFVTRVLL